MNKSDARPIDPKQRIVLLDALRGFALLGIVIANFPEFSLWSFMSEGERLGIAGYGFDRVVNWLIYFLVDGKFYTIFSILFGIGFSIIIERSQSKGANGMLIFYRRMFLLLFIGLFHMFFIWSGDILLLYAVIGMLLPFFSSCSYRALFRWVLLFLLLPIGVEILRDIYGAVVPAILYNKWWSVAAANGINEDNFATWLRDAHDYRHMFAFLSQGAVERMWEFVVGSRYFRVLGLFIIGLYIGRSKMLYHLKDYRDMIRKAFVVSALIGIPVSLLYAWSCISSHPFGEVVHSVLYTFSVYPLATAYITGLSLLYLKHGNLGMWTWLAYPGRMALTCYISQSLFGILIFYGIGLGLGTSVNLFLVTFIALMVFVVEMLLSRLWFRYFLFGPIEWVWRMLTYAKRFPIMLE